jgi:hypothetical protein
MSTVLRRGLCHAPATPAANGFRSEIVTPALIWREKSCKYALFLLASSAHPL